MQLRVAGRDMMWQSGPTAEDLRELLPIFPDGQFQLLRECIDDRRTNAMQPARSFIDPFGEFAPGVRDRQNNGRGGQIIALVEHRIERHATPLIAYRHPALLVNTHPDMLAKARHRLIDGIIQRLPDQMDQAGSRRGTDVHPWTVPDGRHALKHLDVSGRIGRLLLRARRRPALRSSYTDFRLVWWLWWRERK